MRLDIPKRVVLSAYGWGKMRKRVHQEQDGRCIKCGRPVSLEHFHVHHVRLRGMGGANRSDARENLEGLCGGFPGSCHSKEHNQ